MVRSILKIWQDMNAARFFKYVWLLLQCYAWKGKRLDCGFYQSKFDFSITKEKFQNPVFVARSFFAKYPLFCEPSGKYHNLDKHYTCDIDRKKVSIIWTYTFFTFEQPVKIENYLSYYIQKGVFKNFVKFTGIYLRLYIEYTCFSILSQSVGT